MAPNRPSWAHKRPAPRRAAGAPKQISDTVTWTRIVEPRERYRIVYQDRDGAQTIREIELSKMGDSQGTAYLGVTHEGRFKTMRADRVLQVLEQLSTGHPSSLRAAPTYRTELPKFPVEGAVFRVPTIAAGNRTWTVDLNVYTCTCPEKRIRSAKGYKPGQIGFVCPHMAAAILKQLPGDAADWTPELRAFLANPQNVAVEHLR